MHPKRDLNISYDEITRYLYWIQKLKLIKSRGDCLALSLLYYRFLSMAGEEPTLFIGFKNEEGHAWVEILGEVVSESPGASRNITPTLVLHAGKSEFSPAQ